ncbi:uncharacterized protein LOC115383395 [Salarias fasciatus]|uniref:uncharacterized protein LOC115383395 n=1 Tax=Salarias fasciatus TaxID=181472 RepID=UPI001176F8A6|nr:uncharacterized protein LOC115383395 [Salarias fasciatus]
MLSSKDKQRSFGNGRLRDQWEKRAASIADQCKQEAELKQKSSLKVLFSKWNYHWSLVSNEDKMKVEMSEFRQATSGEAENKPRIRFKVVPPPPPKPKPAAAPPPAPPARRSASPRLRREKRKVEVDVFRLCWKDSWMSLKPPKYLFLRARELKNRFLGFTAIELTTNTKYKARRSGSEPELMLPAHKWSRSWKQVKSPAQSKSSGSEKYQWQILIERTLVCNAVIDIYSLPVWAGTWKIMNFPFRQQKKDWDCVWPEYQPVLSDKSVELEQLEEQDELEDWDDSWMLSEETETEADDETPAGINEVCVPGWSRAWRASAAPPQDREEREHSWSHSWSLSQQLRWRAPSLASHQRHCAALQRRRRAGNLWLASQLDRDEEGMDRAEWAEAWRSPRAASRPAARGGDTW